MLKVKNLYSYIYTYTYKRIILLGLIVLWKKQKTYFYMFLGCSWTLIFQKLKPKLLAKMQTVHFAAPVKEEFWVSHLESLS